MKLKLKRTITGVTVAFAYLIASAELQAQDPVKIAFGDNTMTLNTVISTFYNYREYPKGTTEKKDKNTFRLKDARLGVEGSIGTDYDYKLMVDFSGIGNTVIDPSAPPMYDAWIRYKGFHKIANITLGYGKVPYSLSSLIEHEWSPYWSRAEIAKGDCFSRRDLGIKLNKSFLKDRVKAIGGIYSGVGEVALVGTNDPSGALEYIGRVEMSYPDKMPESFIDTKTRKVPNFSLGLNGRYSNRNLPTGTSFLDGEVGALLNDTSLNFKVVNGEKLVYGADFNVHYQGFSAQIEGHTIKGTPQLANDPLLAGLPKSASNGYFKAGGWYAQANYFVRPIKTILSVRYDELNTNDLITGLSKHLAASLCYQIKGYASMLRAEFFRNLSQTEATNSSSWGNQWRIGWQLNLQ